MAKSDDGEFELVLGNRQLLSVFFIVVLLVAVFFTMGYIVGKNSTPGFAEAKRPDRTIGVDGARPSPTSTPLEQPKAPISESARPPETEKAEPAAAPPPKKEAEKKQESQGATPTPEEPVVGQTYVQVVAVQRAEAEIFLDVLG